MSKRYKPTGKADAYEAKELYQYYWRCDGCYDPFEPDQLITIFIAMKAVEPKDIAESRKGELIIKNLCATCSAKPVQHWIDKQKEKENEIE
jgi:hypothetical protein